MNYKIQLESAVLASEANHTLILESPSVRELWSQGLKSRQRQAVTRTPNSDFPGLAVELSRDKDESFVSPLYFSVLTFLCPTLLSVLLDSQHPTDESQGFHTCLGMLFSSAKTQQGTELLLWHSACPVCYYSRANWVTEAQKGLSLLFKIPMDFKTGQQQDGTFGISMQS